MRNGKKAWLVAVFGFHWWCRRLVPRSSAWFVAAFALVFMLPMFLAPLHMGVGLAWMEMRNTICVVQTSSDRAVAAAINGMNLTRFGHPIRHLRVDSPGELRFIVETSIHLVAIYVGHGSPEGLLVGGEVLSWSLLGNWTREAD